MEIKNDLPIIAFKDQQEWSKWLDKHCRETSGLWVKIAKKTSGLTSVNYSETLEEALCYGWIDGQKNSYDQQYYLQKFTPRRSGSIWSKVNVDKCERLISQGRMQASGLAAISLAKKDGRWQQAYDSSKNITVPEDFQMALDLNPKAKVFFASLNKSNSYSFLWRIQTAKRPATRQKRISKYITMLENNQAFR